MGRVLVGPSGRFYTLGSFIAHPALSLGGRRGGGRDDGIARSLCRQESKRKEEAEREAERTEGSVRPPTDGGSKIQTIVISASPEMGSNDQPGLKYIAHAEPREEAPIPSALHDQKAAWKPLGSY